MKKFHIIIILAVSLLILHSCDPASAFLGCEYKYPLNITNLKDTIKTTDTLWVENDFDPRFCLSEGVFKNGIAEEHTIFYRLTKDSLIRYSATIIGYDEVRENVPGFKSYTIFLREQDGRYKSRFGIVFPEQGTYALCGFGGLLENSKNSPISLTNYFNTPTNNIYLIPEHLRNYDIHFYNKEPYQYEVYCLVVE